MIQSYAKITPPFTNTMHKCLHNICIHAIKENRGEELVGPTDRSHRDAFSLSRVVHSIVVREFETAAHGFTRRMIGVTYSVVGVTYLVVGVTYLVVGVTY